MSPSSLIHRLSQVISADHVEIRQLDNMDIILVRGFSKVNINKLSYATTCIFVLW